MHLTRAADYGVRVMVHLGGSGARTSLSALAAAAEVSPAFLSKILQRLVHAGLVVSHRGKRGGFELPDKGRDSTLLDILTALDGVPALNLCLLSGGCHRSPRCAAHLVWLQAQARVIESLSSATLRQLVETGAERKAALPAAN
jgi:Rrf2 family protein